MLKSIILFFLTLMGGSLLYAQQSVNAGGESTTSYSGSISQSIGQSFVQYTTDTSTYQLSEGVQQAFEILSISIQDSVWASRIQLSVYPNPSKTDSYLSIQGEDLDGLQYQLLNANGQVLTHAMIEASKTHLDLQAYTPGLYLLRVFQNNTEISTYKIIKN